MTKQKFNLKLTIATPCPVSWDTMKGDDRKRFCDMCSLNVYNISEMTRAEAENFLANSEGRICGKIYKRADGTILTKDCPVGLRAYRKKVSALAGAAFSMILGLFSVSFGQKQPLYLDLPKIQIERVKELNGGGRLTGVVHDSVGQAVAGAEISLTSAENGNYTIMSDADGRFETDISPGRYQMVVKVEGYFDNEVSEIHIGKNEKITTNISMIAGNIEATVGIVGGFQFDPKLIMELPLKNHELAESPELPKKP